MMGTTGLGSKLAEVYLLISHVLAVASGWTRNINGYMSMNHILFRSFQHLDSRDSRWCLQAFIRCRILQVLMLEPHTVKPQSTNPKP